MSKIFSHGSATVATAAPSSTAQNASTGADTANTAAASSSSPGAVAAGVGASAGGGAAPASVDVTAILDGLAEKNSEDLDWKKSIVDLLKLVGMDSSLSARKELAHDLNYTGDTSDSATMNQWLHKEVLNKLAANGGKVPTELLG